MKLVCNINRAFALVSSVLIATAAVAADVNTSTQKSTDFEDINLTPFSVCTTQSPNYVQPFNKVGANCAKFYWTQTGYDGTRNTKGAEICSDLNIYKDGWHAFKIYIPSTGFPYNKITSVGQFFCEGGCSSWMAMLEIRNNDLYIEHRGACASATLARIAANLPRDAWVRIVCQFRVSHLGTGFIKVWYNGAAQGSPTYNASNINLGFGDWDGNDTLISAGDAGIFGSGTDNMVRLKDGMYCWDTANYTAGEYRILYYDNVVHIAGNPSGAWNACNF